MRICFGSRWRNFGKWKPTRRNCRVSLPKRDRCCCRFPIRSLSCFSKWPNPSARARCPRHVPGSNSVVVDARLQAIDCCIDIFVHALRSLNRIKFRPLGRADTSRERNGRKNKG